MVFSLFTIVFSFSIVIIMGISDSYALGSVFSFISGVFLLAITLPSYTVAVRRLNDTNRSGWMLLISFIPLLGILE